MLSQEYFSSPERFRNRRLRALDQRHLPPNQIDFIRGYVLPRIVALCKDERSKRRWDNTTRLTVRVGSMIGFPVLLGLVGSAPLGLIAAGTFVVGNLVGLSDIVAGHFEFKSKADEARMKAEALDSALWEFVTDDNPDFLTFRSTVIAIQGAQLVTKLELKLPENPDLSARRARLESPNPDQSLSGDKKAQPTENADQSQSEHKQ